eukprot:g1134.t1
MDGSAMLPFQQDIAHELASENCLFLLATGLGWENPLSAMLVQHVSKSRTPVLLLGFRPHQKQSLREALLRLDPKFTVPVDITTSVLSNERRKLYSNERCCFVTTRILVVDFLSSKLQTTAVAGLVIMNAQRITDDSGEAFVVRLFKKGHPIGFIRAISDQPSAFVSGIRKAEEVMRALHVRRLSLWPRFQLQVKGSLESLPLQVVEVAQSMTLPMVSIQNSIKELISFLLKELKRTNTFESSELTVENALFSSFDKMAKRQLDLVWHTTTWKTKQLVEDLQQLRELLSDLMNHDAVSFLSFLERIKSTGDSSIWLFHNAAHDIFQTAKSRVYKLVLEEEKQNKRVKSETGTALVSSKFISCYLDKQQRCLLTEKPAIHPVLEQLPKWAALRDILVEHQSVESPIEDQGSILVVCKELFLSTQLELALKDPVQLMKQLFDEYLIARKQAEANDTYGNQSRRHHINPQSKMSLYSRRDLMKMIPESATPTEIFALEEATEKAEPVKSTQKRKQSPQEEPVDNTEVPEEDNAGRPSLLYDKELLESDRNAELLQNVQFHALDSQEESILWTVKPKVVILYHTDLGFIRQIEVYQAENPEQELKVYLLYYDESIEKTLYEVSVTKETEAFSELIQHKGRIMIPTDLDAKDEDQSMEDSTPMGLEQRNAMTRKGGGRASSSLMVPNKKIVVDMREFMSKLPVILHKHNFDLHPLTLEIGDYILAPGVVVERKSIADLNSSMRSGRLYNQIEAMVKKFELPILLIEFEANKQFRIQNDEELGQSISPHNILSKLTLLILHFPKLKLIWSPSPQTTCEIFSNFKRGRPDPKITEGVEVVEPREVMNKSAVDILK